MRLSRLFIKHFKGIEKLEIEPNGKNITVRGENGTGKTTIADAYSWVLTGKGIDGTQIDGQIKARDEGGNCPNDGGIEHIVEAELVDDDGKPFTVRREYVEKWEKKRGEVESQFKGHTTKYYFDGVPLQKSEFEEKMNSLCDEKLFRLLSMPLSFCSMKWQDRRKVLMEIVGNISDADVIASSEELAPLTKIMDGKSIDDVRKILKNKLTKTNDAMKGIPARIDELTKMIEQDGLQSEEVMRNDLMCLENQKSNFEKKLFQLENGGAIGVKEKELASLEAELTRVKTKYMGEYQTAKQELEGHLNSCRIKHRQVEQDFHDLMAKRDRLNAIIATQDKQMAALRQEWMDENAKTADLNISDICPTCGQKLPPDKLEEAKQKALEEFNFRKSKTLEEINSRGKRMKEQKTTDEKNRDSVVESMLKVQAENEVLAGKEEAMEKELNAMAEPNYKEQPEYLNVESKISRIKNEIESLKSDDDTEIINIRNDIAALKLDISTRSEKLAIVQQRNQSHARIQELKQEEKDLGKVYNNIQHQLYLTEQFLRAQVSLTEDGINKHFKYVKFRMFEQQINGGLKQCCEPLIDGVPYSDGLNKGSRMKAALDILNTLSEHYHKTLPVIIDDCESYTSLIPVNSQTIRLIADKKYESLNVEVEENE